MSTWDKHEGGGAGYIPVDKWGKDHWSTLAYFETAVVDNKGKLENLRMRCNARQHRELVGIHNFGGMLDAANKYPTRLQDGEEAWNHDDWSCAEDMVEAGLIEMWTRELNVVRMFGNREARVAITPLGLQVTGMLRAHKAEGGVYATFHLTTEDLNGLEEHLEALEEIVDVPN